MASQADPDPCEVIPHCGVCGGKMETVFNRPSAKVCVCVDCHTSVSLPPGAWKIAVAKYASGPKPRVERRKNLR